MLLKVERMALWRNGVEVLVTDRRYGTEALSGASGWIKETGKRIGVWARRSLDVGNHGVIGRVPGFVKSILGAEFIPIA